MHYWVTQSVQLRDSDSIPILHLQLSLTFEVTFGHSRSSNPYWKTHPEFFPKFKFSGARDRPISGKLIQNFIEF